MQFTTTITRITDDFATALDKGIAEIVENTPGPLDQLVRRLGAVYVEAVHQSGRVVVVTFEVVEGIVRVVSTGVSTIEGQARAAVSGGIDAARTVGESTATAVQDAGDSIERAAKTASGEVSRRLKVVGGTVDHVEDVVEAAVEGGAERVAASVDDAVAETLEAGTDGPSGAYEGWTKDQLYERAQELDLDGRSTMKKNELIAALRSA